MSEQEKKRAGQKPVYLTVDEVAEILGCACSTCQKKLYLALGRKATEAKFVAVPPRGPFIALEDELDAVCAAEGVSREVVDQGNQEKAVHVRRLFSRRARELGYSYPQIGRFLGRHHTTIMHLVLTDGYSEKRAAQAGSF
jgi:hypothetical protein